MRCPPAACHTDGLLPCRHARSASGDGPCVPSWTRQLKAANEEYAALNAKYLETDGAKQFIAEQQTAIAAAAECEVASSEAEDEGEEEQSATIKRKRRAPKQKKDPNGAVGALACRHSPRKMCLRPCQCVRLKQAAASYRCRQRSRLVCFAAPKKPVSAYFLFQDSHREKVRRTCACWRPALGLVVGSTAG